MVLKRGEFDGVWTYEFENDVKMYGTQTSDGKPLYPVGFENDVKMYGTQTLGANNTITCGFENDVKMYGTQTVIITTMYH